jgi:hypothetical protein
VLFLFAAMWLADMVKDVYRVPVSRGRGLEFCLPVSTAKMSSQVLPAPRTVWRADWLLRSNVCTISSPAVRQTSKELELRLSEGRQFRRRLMDAGVSGRGQHEQEAGAIRRRHRNISSYKEGKRSAIKEVEERRMLVVCGEEEVNHGRGLEKGVVR